MTSSLAYLIYREPPERKDRDSRRALGHHHITALSTYTHYLRPITQPHTSEDYPIMLRDPLSTNSSSCDQYSRRPRRCRIFTPQQLPFGHSHWFSRQPRNQKVARQGEACSQGWALGFETQMTCTSTGQTMMLVSQSILPETSTIAKRWVSESLFRFYQNSTLLLPS